MKTTQVSGLILEKFINAGVIKQGLSKILDVV